MAISRQTLFPLFGLGSYDYGILFYRYPMEAANDLVNFAFLWSLIYFWDRHAAARKAELAREQATYDAHLLQVRQEVWAAVTELDQAVISRIENGERLPTEEQVIRLAGLYGLDPNRTLTDWLSEKIVREYGDSPYASKAIRIAQERIMYNIRQSKDKDIT